jgi:hypothetical protein
VAAGVTECIATAADGRGSTAATSGAAAAAAAALPDLSAVRCDRRCVVRAARENSNLPV